MWKMVLPLLLIVASNCFYNICTKSVPKEADTFGVLTVTYLIGAAVSAILFTVSVKPRNLGEALGKLNWVPFVLGLAIIGLEVGYVLLYRAGWKVSNGALTANICLAAALLVIGALLYHESISVRQIIGVAVCAVGLYLIR